MTANRPKVLVIEDDPAIQRFLRASLTSHDYEMVEATTGKLGLLFATEQQPDLVILDLGLPDSDGVQIVRELRGWSHLPIIIVSARGQEKDKVLALDAGADDYLTKPFGMPELLARMRVALRHASRVEEGDAEGELEFELGDLRIDLARRLVFRGGEQIHLTPIEYRLLAILVRHAGKVLTHQFLLREVWGPTYVNQSHYLRIFMSNLRRKLEADPACPRYLLTEQGVGYRLCCDG
ncbi:MAG: response regulator [Phycisphaerae bacterium]|nr:response regulator [Phycisphaerae bacterium]